MKPVKLVERNPAVFEAYQLTTESLPTVTAWLEANGYIVWRERAPNCMSYASKVRSEKLRLADFGQWVVLDTKAGVAATYSTIETLFKESEA